MTVLVNGTPATEVSVFDRALQFGEGVFETIACLEGRPRLLPLHLERLEYVCERL
jgi:4-amino-4-deoxychorismate lyase